MKMNSSDSECFESADEEFESEIPNTSSKSSHILKEPTTHLEKIEINEKAVEEAHKTEPNDIEKKDKRKPKFKLGTRIPKVRLESPLNIEAETPCNIKNIAETAANTTDEVLPVRDEPNLWEGDDWDIDQPQKEPNINAGESSWSSWGTWGVSSLLSTATTITNQVSQGLTTVIESSIGAPDPVALAKQDQQNQPSNNSPDPIFGIGNFNNLISGVTQITKLVETTGTRVISGGLDTLETIGKKTMEVLQEGDPGFKKKRAFLKIDSEKPVLSHILREAKEKAEQENKILEQKHFTKKANYELLFDDHEGLVHLEALEMLSKQCDIKLQTLMESKSGSELIEMQETMTQIKELCELNEDDEDELFNAEEIEDKLLGLVTEINIKISYDKLIKTWRDVEDWFGNVNLSVCSERELHEQAIDTLAQLTALSVEQFHKTGELLLIKQHRSTVDEADSLVQLTTLLINLIGYIATVLSNKLLEKSSSCKNQENINNFITNIYYEAANSSSYIKNAFQLLLPVLQVGAI